MTLLACGACICDAQFSHAAPLAAPAPAASAAVKEVGGKSFDAAGNPTYTIQPDGTVDWHTFSGFRRYNGTCNVCHGPDGDGSSFAPALKDSIKTLSYIDFYGIVAGGRVNVTSSQDNVMPSFGDNKNVMCYLDDIYIYLRARADGMVPAGRPSKAAAKPKQAAEDENQCMGP